MAQQQIVTPLDKLEALTPFEGTAVIGTGIEISGAAGGLSDALAVDPLELHKGDRVYVLIEGEVGKIRFDPVKGVDGLNRVHVLSVTGVAIVDKEFAQDALDEQAREACEAEREAVEREDLAARDELADRRHAKADG
jgi:hypothetical protein